MGANRKSLDAHLLRILQILLLERNVSRAARRLSLSQPAVSAALKRLRQLTGDPLLVRSHSGMIPTEHGQELLTAARIALEQMERIAGQRRRSETTAPQRRFEIAAPACIDPLLLGRVCADLRRQAPLSRLNCRALGYNEDYVLALETGELDLVLADWPRPASALRVAPLFRDRLVCLMRHGHPLENRLDTLGYLTAEHLALTPNSTAQRDRLEQFLARERLRRRVVIQVPDAAFAPEILRRSELLYTCPHHIADYLGNGLAQAELPLDCPDVDYYLLWHERTHADLDCRWLRDRLVREAAARCGQTH
jgi:DNA-binding transcriptional LysR family regulator